MRFSFKRWYPSAWPWPAPALLAWALCWAVFRLAAMLLVPVLALGLASACGVALSLWGVSWWRRLLIGAGFPLSLALTQPALGFAALPAWAWLLSLLLLLLIYPVNAWRDAPVFPTPEDALQPLPYGLEWSWLLRWVSAVRCPWAHVRRGDIWITDWSGFDMVYLFQRPESMTRAVIKAAELRPGAWLVSLEFPASHLRPDATYRTPGGKTVWLYQAPVTVA